MKRFFEQAIAGLESGISSLHFVKDGQLAGSSVVVPPSAAAAAAPASKEPAAPAVGTPALQLQEEQEEDLLAEKHEAQRKRIFTHLKLAANQLVAAAVEGATITDVEANVSLIEPACVALFRHGLKPFAGAKLLSVSAVVQLAKGDGECDFEAPEELQQCSVGTMCDKGWVAAALNEHKLAALIQAAAHKSSVRECYEPWALMRDTETIKLAVGLTKPFESFAFDLSVVLGIGTDVFEAQVADIICQQQEAPAEEPEPEQAQEEQVQQEEATSAEAKKEEEAAPAKEPPEMEPPHASMNAETVVVVHKVCKKGKRRKAPKEVEIDGIYTKAKVGAPSQILEALAAVPTLQHHQTEEEREALATQADEILQTLTAKRIQESAQFDEQQKQDKQQDKQQDNVPVEEVIPQQIPPQQIPTEPADIKLEEPLSDVKEPEPEQAPPEQTQQPQPEQEIQQAPASEDVKEQEIIATMKPVEADKSTATVAEGDDSEPPPLAKVESVQPAKVEQPVTEDEQQDDFVVVSQEPEEEQEPDKDDFVVIEAAKPTSPAPRPPQKQHGEFVAVAPRNPFLDEMDGGEEHEAEDGEKPSVSDPWKTLMSSDTKSEEDSLFGPEDEPQPEPQPKAAAEIGEEMDKKQEGISTDLDGAVVRKSERVEPEELSEDPFSTNRYPHVLRVPLTRRLVRFVAWYSNGFVRHVQFVFSDGKVVGTGKAGKGQSLEYYFGQDEYVVEVAGTRGAHSLSYLQLKTNQGIVLGPMGTPGKTNFVFKANVGQYMHNVEVVPTKTPMYFAAPKSIEPLWRSLPGLSTGYVP